MIKNQGGVVPAEKRDLLIPTGTVSACAMGKDQRWALAIGFIVQIHAISCSNLHFMLSPGPLSP
jgi:hypothetical protein